MLDPISDTPLVLAYAFMSLLVLIVCFIIFNVVHKIYIDAGAGVSTNISSSISYNKNNNNNNNNNNAMKTTLLEVDALKTG